MRGLAGRLSAMTSDGGVGGRYVWSMAATAWSLGNRPSIGLATPPKSHHEQNWPVKSHPDRRFVRKKTPRRIMPTKMSRAVDGQFSPTRRHIVPVSLNFLVCHIVNFPVETTGEIYRWGLLFPYKNFQEFLQSVATVSLSILTRQQPG